MAEEREALKVQELAEQSIVKVDFIADIEEKHIIADKLIMIVALHGGVIISPRVIWEFREAYKNDLNKLIRDATKY